MKLTATVAAGEEEAIVVVTKDRRHWCLGFMVSSFNVLLLSGDPVVTTVGAYGRTVTTIGRLEDSITS